MAQFTDLEWTARPGGFEANYTFENYHQIHIQCGSELYSEGAIDETVRSAATEYTVFEYKTFDGVTVLEDDGNWIVGGVADINSEMTRLEGLAAVYTPPAGE